MSELQFDRQTIERVVEVIDVLVRLADAFGIERKAEVAGPSQAELEQFWKAKAMAQQESTQQPQALRQRGPRRGRPPANVTYDTADVDTLRAFIGTVAGEGGTKAEMIDKILGALGALNPAVVQSEFAKVGITLALSLIKRQLGLWRKRRQQSAT